MKAKSQRLLAVIDTNVWISGFLSKTGSPALLLQALLEKGQPVFSSTTFAELQERLYRPKFDRYISIDQRKQLLHDVAAIAYWVTVPKEIEQQAFSRDPDDDKFIHAALTAKTPWLITGDQDLLVLANDLLLINLQVLSPTDSLKLMPFN